MDVWIEAMPLPGLVDLINGWGSTPRREAGEQELRYPSLDGLQNRLGVPSWAVPEADASLAAVADQLHPIFADHDIQTRGARINDLLTVTAVRPALREDQNQLHEGWLVATAKQALLAAASIALRSYVAENSAGRLGTCAGRRCVDAYVDTSPSGRRRYCSVTCQNRERVAAYRSRQTAT